MTAATRLQLVEAGGAHGYATGSSETAAFSVAQESGSHTRRPTACLCHTLVRLGRISRKILLVLGLIVGMGSPQRRSGSCRMWKMIAVLLISVPVSGHDEREEALAERRAAWEKCDRSRSRMARSILNEEVYPVVEKKGYIFPSTCPWSKQQDMYLDNEMVVSIYLFVDSTLYLVGTVNASRSSFS
jgi:hypothetical protein